MSRSPHCQATEDQPTHGRTPRGSRRYKCRFCQRVYTPEPLPLGYSDETKREAVGHYLEGINFRRIGRILGANHQSVINRVNAYHANLPAAEQPVAKPETLETDELFTLVGSKKRAAYIVAIVDRATRRIVAREVCESRTPELMQSVVDAAPHARSHFSDGFKAYRGLCWWGAHTSMYEKSQTYSVEGTNADLLHYLARPARRLCFFSRRIKALTRALMLFVRFYNARQLKKRKYPRYPAPLATMI
jgi:IS1 family transposase